MGPLTIIKWANRALYLLLFISALVVMNQWHLTITYTFLGAVFCLVLSVLFLPQIEPYPKALELPVHEIPKVIRVEPASTCNLRCIHCPTGLRCDTKKRGLMTLQTFEKVLREIEDIAPLVVVLYHGGEPFLNQNIFYMIDKIKALGVKTVKTITNGTLLKEDDLYKLVRSGLDSITFSLDGSSGEENNTIRIGSDYEKVLSTIKRLIALKHEAASETPKIIIGNCQIPLEQELRNGGPEVPRYLIDAFSEYNNEAITIESCWAIFWSEMPLETNEYYLSASLDEGPLLNYCEHPYVLITIRYNGDLAPCCYDTLGSYVLGNIHTSSIKSAWNNKLYQTLRESIHNRIPLSLCVNCREINPTRHLLRKELEIPESIDDSTEGIIANVE